MTQWRRFITEGVPPGSLAAYGFTFAVIAVATLARFLVGAIGDVLIFATYFPAVLIIALIAGTRAGALAVVASILIAWWAFVPPYYRFEIPTLVQATNYLLFAMSALVIVWLTHGYRRALFEMREQEKIRALFVRELEHRGKNTYAVVEAIVHQSLPENRDLAKTITGRIRAVSKTNDIVTHSPDNSVSLHQLLELEFEPFDRARVALSGPYLALAPDIARGMALVFHELITNAVKYGSLSNDVGRVQVDWQWSDPMVHATWIETGGPQIITPKEFGFGSRLVTRTLKRFGGEVIAAFPPGGLNCRISFRLR